MQSDKKVDFHNSQFSMLLRILNCHTFMHNTNKHIAQFLAAETI